MLTRSFASQFFRFNIQVDNLLVNLTRKGKYSKWQKSRIQVQLAKAKITRKFFAVWSYFYFIFNCSCVIATFLRTLEFLPRSAFLLLRLFCNRSRAGFNGLAIFWYFESKRAFLDFGNARELELACFDFPPRCVKSNFQILELAKSSSACFLALFLRLMSNYRRQNIHFG